MQTLREQYLQTLHNEETERAYGRDIARFFVHIGLEDGTLGDLENKGLPDLYGSLYEFLQAYLKWDETQKHVINQKTFNRVRQGNASFFKYLQLFYGFPFNPAAYIKKMRERRKSNTPALTEAEVLHLLWRLKNRASRSEKDARDFLMVLGLTLEAVRRSELAAFSWDAIDFAQETIRIYQKGDTEKILPVPPGYLRLLSDFGEKYGRPCPFIFRPIRNNRYKELNRHVSVDTIYRVVRKIAQEVVPDRNISPHSFRTTFVSLGIKWKVHIVAIQNGGGWSTMEMVFYYDRNDPLENNMVHIMGERVHKEKII